MARNTISWLPTLALALATLTTAQNTDRFLNSTSFTTCTPNSQLTASGFGVEVTPNNNTLTYALFGENKFSGNVTLNFLINVNSKPVYSATFDPCSGNSWASFCPSTPGQIALTSSQEIPDGVLDRIPDSVYTDSDPDAEFRFVMRERDSNRTVGCLSAKLENEVSQRMGGNGTSSTNGTTNGNGTDSGDSNDNSNNASNSSDGSGGGDSGASTAYLNWTLLLSGMLALLFAFMA